MEGQLNKYYTLLDNSYLPRHTHKQHTQHTQYTHTTGTVHTYSTHAVYTQYTHSTQLSTHTVHTHGTHTNSTHTHTHTHTLLMTQASVACKDGFAQAVADGGVESVRCTTDGVWRDENNEAPIFPVCVSKLWFF